MAVNNVVAYGNPTSTCTSWGKLATHALPALLMARNKNMPTWHGTLLRISRNLLGTKGHPLLYKGVTYLCTRGYLLLHAESPI
jgi:hypothetical protein